MNARDANLRFPVLAITTERDTWLGVWGLPNLDILERCGFRILRWGYQDGMELIDIDGRCFFVKSVRKLGRDRPLIPWLFWTAMTGGPRYLVEHDLEPRSPLSLAEVKEKVWAAVRSHVDSWCAETKDDWTWGDDPNQALPILFERVMACGSIEEISSALSLDDFRVF